MVSRWHRNSSKKKSKDRSCFIFLPLFCIKKCKDVLARHKAFFHIPNFQVVQGKHILLFFFLLREKEMERELALIKDPEGCQGQLITWVVQHLITIFWYQLPRNKSYLRKETPMILNTRVARMRGGKVWRKEGLSDRENTWSSTLSSSCGSP